MRIWSSLSVPVGASESVAREIAGSLKPGAIVTDVGSTKASVIAQMQPYMPPHVHFIPGHPAGGYREVRSGCRFSGPLRGALVHLHADCRARTRQR